MYYQYEFQPKLKRVPKRQMDLLKKRPDTVYHQSNLVMSYNRKTHIWAEEDTLKISCFMSTVSNLPLLNQEHQGNKQIIRRDVSVFRLAFKFNKKTGRSLMWGRPIRINQNPIFPERERPGFKTTGFRNFTLPNWDIPSGMDSHRNFRIYLDLAASRIICDWLGIAHKRDISFDEIAWVARTGLNIHRSNCERGLHHWLVRFIKSVDLVKPDPESMILRPLEPGEELRPGELFQKRQYPFWDENCIRTVERTLAESPRQMAEVKATYRLEKRRLRAARKCLSLTQRAMRERRPMTADELRERLEQFMVAINLRGHADATPIPASLFGSYAENPLAVFDHEYLMIMIKDLNIQRNLIALPRPTYFHQRVRDRHRAISLLKVFGNEVNIYKKLSSEYSHVLLFDTAEAILRIQAFNQARLAEDPTFEPFKVTTKGPLREVHDIATRLARRLQDENSNLRFQLDLPDQEYRIGKKTYLLEYPKTGADLIQVGEDMRHCVGGYCYSVAKGECQIFVLRDHASKPLVCCEIYDNRLRQAQAYANSRPSRTLLKIVAKHCEERGYDHNLYV